MQEPSPRQQTEPRTEAASRILESAKMLFAERGYDGVSIRDIAEKARVSKANVFHHFGNKASLYEAILEEAAEKLGARMHVLRDPTLGVHERIARFALEDLQEQINDPHCASLFLRELITPRNTAQRRQAEQVIARSLRSLLTLLEELRSTGELPPQADPLALSLAIGGGNILYFQLQGILAELREDQEPTTPETFSRALMQLIKPAVDNGATPPSVHKDGTH